MASRFRLRSAANLLWQAAVLLVIVYALVALRPGHVAGQSMEPGIADAEDIIIDALAYRIGSPHRGDIVAFVHERSAPTVYLKRMIGLPGDRVAIERGTVYVDGERLVEPYVRYHDDRSYAPLVVPPDSYYVLGDNRPKSDDSRSWGFVPHADLIGRAEFAFWPLAHVGLVR